MSDKTAADIRNQAKALAKGLLDSNAVGPRTRVEMKKRDDRDQFRRGEFVVEDSRGRLAELGAVDEVVMMKSHNRPQWATDLQEFNDCCLMLSAALQRPVESLNYFKKGWSRKSSLRKDLDTETAGSGNEWIPTNYSQQFVEFVDLKLQVVNLFQRIPMPTDPYKVPFQSSQITVIFAAEQTSDFGTRIAESSPGTNNFTLDAKKIAVRTAMSVEMTEDSIVPALPMARKEMAFALAKGLDYAVLNGDTSSTHMDTNVTGSTHRGKMFRGLRFQAHTNSHRTSVSTFNNTALRTGRGNMAKYGVNPGDLAWITSPKVYMRHFLNLSEVVTVDKYGPSAVILNGELGKVDGIPIVVSNEFPENLNTTGTYDGTTTDNGAALLVYRPAFYFGTKRDITIKLWDEPTYDQLHLVGTGRYAFNTPWTTDRVVEAFVDASLA